MFMSQSTHSSIIYSVSMTIALLMLHSTVGAQEKNKQSHNYVEALQKALYFYEAQEAGPLSKENRVEFRGPSTLRDGSDVKRDLTGGWYDAGDNVKWTNNDAFGATMFAWALIRHRETFRKTHQYERALDNLRHGTDFLLRCVDTKSPTGFRIYCGIGNKRTSGPNDPVNPGDHGSVTSIAEWIDVPQTIRVVDGVALPGSVRPSYWVDKATGGPDVGGHVAAALAASSIVFRKAGDVKYADQLLAVARLCDKFANDYPKASTVTRRLKDGAVVNLPSYPSRRKQSVQVRIWSSAWLARAEKAARKTSNAKRYLEQALTIHKGATEKERGYPWNSFSTGNVGNGAYCILAADTGAEEWMRAANKYCDFWLYRRSSQTGLKTDITVTPAGFVCRGDISNGHDGAGWNIHCLLDSGPPMLEWADSRYNKNRQQKSDLVSLFTGTYTVPGNKYPVCPVVQIDYILGDNPLKMSYLQGYARPGDTWVRNLHYRATWGGYGGFGTPKEDVKWNTFPVYGLLAPGPDAKDNYPTERQLSEGTIIQYQEPIIYSGGMLTVLARKIEKEGRRAGKPLAVFPEWIMPDENERDQRYFVKAYRRSDQAPALNEGVRIVAEIHSRSFIEPQERNQLGFRVYITLDKGTRLKDLTITQFWAGKSASWSGPIADGKNRAYFLIRFKDDYIGPGEFQNFKRRVELIIAKKAGSWDIRNDHSLAKLDVQKGLMNPPKIAAEMPVYDYSSREPEILGGLEPSAGYIRWRRARFNNTWEQADAITVIAERIGGEDGKVSARVSLKNGSAVLGKDFKKTTSSILEWKDGERGPKILRIPLIDDKSREGREEFTISVGSLRGGLKASDRMDASVTIEDND